MGRSGTLNQTGLRLVAGGLEKARKPSRYFDGEQIFEAAVRLLPRSEKTRSAIGVAAPVIFALETFPDYQPAVILLAAMESAKFLVGSVLTPRLQGKSLNLDPVAMFFSLGFWGAIWGVAGIFLSTPLTLTAMLIMAQFPGTRWIAVLLSADGDPDGVAKGKGAHDADSGNAGSQEATAQV
jgi:hypothetical protein